MKRFFLTVLTVSLSLSLLSCTQKTQDTKSGTTPAKTVAIEDPLSVNDVANYKNPIIRVNDPNTWTDYGVGDPFVMRWNGRYYLYCSTKDGRVGIQCWTSDDLVEWEYAGLCAKESKTMSAYAPEVVYYNGNFYMYTSPAGKGHYVLKSDSPTGPFTIVTNNFGLSIDGNVFIDDDGSWHFYSAAVDAISVYPMSAPDKVESSHGTKIPGDLHGWTEGSMIVKHDDVYYLTYTGNHVWSAGYRIHYAISKNSPTKFTTAKNNPLLLSTDDKTVKGIGHSSTVLGPNLDEYYIVYHSHKVAPQRSMNIDRLFLNGMGTVALGPTIDRQDAPHMPDVYSRMETEDDLRGWTVENGKISEGSLRLTAGGSILSEHRFTGDYTAEYNLLSLTDSAGVLFGYTDAQNFGKAVYDASTQKLTVTFTENGTATEKSCTVSASFSDKLRADALILFTVRKSGSEYTFFVNNRKVLQCTSDLASGAVGMLCEAGSATVGFVGASGHALQSSFAEVYKSVENMIPAVTCTEDEQGTTLDGIQYLSVNVGKHYSYKTNVHEEDTYDFTAVYRSTEACSFDVYQGGIPIGTVTLPASKGKDTGFAVRGFDLAKGLYTITLVATDGSAQLLGFSFHKAEAVSEKNYAFSGSVFSSYKDGEWSVKDGKLHLQSPYGKYMVGSENWGDYVVEADVTPTSENINVGLCVRVSNPATVEKGASSIAGGTDFLQGYFIGLSDQAIVLGKHNYNWKELARIPFDIQRNTTYTLRVTAKGNLLKISINGVPVLEYEDKDSPFLHGMVGLRGHTSTLACANIAVRPAE